MKAKNILNLAAIVVVGFALTPLALAGDVNPPTPVQNESGVINELNKLLGEEKLWIGRTGMCKDWHIVWRMYNIESTKYLGVSEDTFIGGSCTGDKPPGLGTVIISNVSANIQGDTIVAVRAI